jgi:hypothetical protein
MFWLCVPVFLWQIYSYQELIPLSESVLIAIMIACTSVNPGSAAGKVLEWQHLKFTGVLSYNFYLWQQIFLRGYWRRSAAGGSLNSRAFGWEDGLRSGCQAEDGTSAAPLPYLQVKRGFWREIADGSLLSTLWNPVTNERAVLF